MNDRSFRLGCLVLAGLGLLAAAAPAATTNAPWTVPARWAVQSLPHHPEFVFSLYGAPGEVESLRQLMTVMRDQHVGNGFDPGPGLQSAAAPLFQMLADAGWPAMCYPGCADMQIDGGRCILGPAHAAALASMDRAGVFAAVQLGEWGYYFHNLSPRESWWHDVYGADFPAFQHLMKPQGLAGYDHLPANRQEAYDAVRTYFTHRQRDLLGRVISVTGHSHYEAYAGEWGAACIGLEVGENIAFTQSKFAFARGASRQWSKPWSVQVSPWFAGACTSNGPLRREGGGARGLDAGHSLSLYERMWLHGWFAGAAMVTPENSISSFFTEAAAPWTLTTHGRRAAEAFAFMRRHDRGVPYTPVAVVLDHLAGYNGYMDKPWGILPPTPGDRATRDLFDEQLFPGADHIHRPAPADNPEASYLRPTPHGEIFDVQLSSADAALLAAYPVLLLAGDLAFPEEFVAKLEQSLRAGHRVLLTPAHQAALGPRYARLAAYPGLERLAAETNPATGRPAAVAPARLAALSRELLPVRVAGDPIQFAVNRLTNGWVVELVNNRGVTKRPGDPAEINPSAVARVVLEPGFPPHSVREWRSGRVLAPAEPLRFEVGPGQTIFVEFTEPR